MLPKVHHLLISLLLERQTVCDQVHLSLSVRTNSTLSTEPLHPLQNAWHNMEFLTIFGNGQNVVPTIHVKDLAG